jgi:signal transduction histidine kinase
LAAVHWTDWLSHPYRHGLLLAATVFVGELLIMVALHWLAPLPAWVDVLIDAFLITGLVSPLLYRFMLRPMITQIAVIESAQVQLRRNNRELRALSQAEHDQRRLAEALIEASAALNSSLDLDEVLDRILEQTERVAPCPAMGVLLFRGDWVEIPRYRSSLGVPLELLPGFPLAKFALMRDLAAVSRPRLIADTRRDAAWIDIPGIEWARSLVLAPLVESGHTIGCLVTVSDQPNGFRSEMLDLLGAFAAYAAVALQHANLYRAESRARQTAETLSAASLALTQTLELQTVLDLLLSYLHQLVPFGIGSVALLESESHLVVQARTQFGPAPAAPSIVPAALDLLEHPHLQRLFAHPQAVLIRNRAEALAWASDIAPDWTPAGELSWLAIPIVAGGRGLGYCVLEQATPNGFAPDQIGLAEAVVGQAAVAIQNAWLFQQVRAGHDRLQSLAYRLVETQENERLHVARELHDEAGQLLASLLLGLRVLESNADKPPAVLAAVHELRQIANTVQENLHRLAMDLRPASLDRLGPVAALDALAIQVRDRNHLAVQFKALGWSEERLTPEVEVSVYRIAQEALTNVVRHAQATRVDLLLQRTAMQIVLTVEDDGVGFDPDAAEGANHLGLAGMRERCEMLGGRLIIESTLGGGTTLVAEVAYGDSSTHL